MFLSHSSRGNFSDFSWGVKMFFEKKRHKIFEDAWWGLIKSRKGKEKIKRVDGLCEKAQQIKAALSTEADEAEILEAADEIAKVRDEVFALWMELEEYQEKRNSRSLMLRLLCAKKFEKGFEMIATVNTLYFARLLKEVTEIWLEKRQRSEASQGPIRLHGREYSLSECLRVVRRAKKVPSLPKLQDAFNRGEDSPEWKRLPKLKKVVPCFRNNPCVLMLPMLRLAIEAEDNASCASEGSASYLSFSVSSR